VVYERETGVNLADAVAASCAVPGVIRPVAVGDRLLVDGGVVSPTNADVALEDGEATITVIVSPMSGTGARSAVGRACSMFATRRLVSELRRSHLSGDVLVIEPSESLGALVIDDALDPATPTRVLGDSFLAPSRAAVTRHEISPGRPRAADH
jgi:NTE family protein